MHVHVPAGAVPKDGPSAGVTMTTALVSLATGRPVRGEVGMTGEVSLTGRVLPIGGVKQKLLAAQRAGLTEVFVPPRNEPDLDDVPADVLEAVTVHLVSDVREILAHGAGAGVGGGSYRRRVTLRVIGAGLPRTGTRSLKTALELLLGQPCHHMHDFFGRPERADLWREAFRGRAEWDRLLEGYAAGLDTPVCAFWRELAWAHPDAIVLLSHRASAETWWRSVDATVLAQARLARDPGHPPRWLADAGDAEREAVAAVFGWLETTLGSLDDVDRATAAYDAWLADVRTTVPPARLVEWQPGDGWEPLCTALGLPVPDAPFPHENSTAEFVSRSANRS